MQFKEIHRKFPFKSCFKERKHGVGTRTHRRLVGAGRRADLGSTVLRPTQEAEATGLLIQQTHAESCVRVWSRGPRSITTGDGCTWSRGSRLLSATAAGAGFTVPGRWGRGAHPRGHQQRWRSWGHRSGLRRPRGGTDKTSRRDLPSVPCQWGQVPSWSWAKKCQGLPDTL